MLVQTKKSANSLEHFKWAATWMLSGGVLPREFLPSWLRFATDHLPFRFLFGIPVEVYQGRTTLQPSDWLEMGAWTLFLSWFLFWIWDKGRQKYTSAGG